MESLSYGFGEFVRGLRNGSYSVIYGDSTLDPPAACFALRLPFIPLFAFAVGTIVDDVRALLIVWSVLSSALMAFSFHLARKQLNAPSSVAMFVLLSGSLFLWKMVAAVSVEEAYLCAPLVVFCAHLLFSRASQDRISPFICGILLSMVSLTKSSTLLLVLFLAIAYAFWTPGKLARRAIPFVCVALSLAAWGTFVWSKTGRFGIGSQSSSMNGINLYKGQNPYFLERYPYSDLDYMHRDGLMDFPYKVSSEWELSDGFLRLANDFRKQHRQEFVQGLAAKLKMMFVQLDGLKTNETESVSRKVSVTFAVSRVIFWTWLLGSLCVPFMRQKSALMSRISILGWGQIITLGLPYLLGFFYHRHFAPVYAYCTITVVPLFAEINRTRKGVEASAS